MNMKHTLRERVLLTTLFVLLLSVVGATKAYAEEFIATSPSGHEIKYQIISIDAKTVRTIRYYNNDQLYIYHGNLVIPSTVTYQNDTYSVIEIDSYTFMDQTLLTSVEIPGSVTTIGYDAFKNCTGLTGTLTIGENIVSICSGAFNNTNYSTLNYNAINCTGYSNFDNCAPNPDDTNEKNGWLGDCPNLTTLHIGENVVNLPGFLFAYCNFTGTLTIPNTVTYIGWKTFYHCQDFSGRLTIPESVTAIGRDAFAYCTGFTELYFNAINFEGEGGSYNPPENVFFGNCTSLTTLVIGENVQSIGPHSFVSCHFTNHVIIPNSVTNIGYDAFTNCTGITEVTIGEGVASLGTAFKNCTSLATIHYNAINCAEFHANYNEVNYTFTNCDALRTLTIGNNVQTIPANSFAYTSLTGSITIPNSVTTIKSNAFAGVTGITEITIGESVSTMVGIPFTGCSSLTTINYNATNLTSSFWYTGEWTGCPAVSTLTIGSNVTSIPDYIFKGLGFSCTLSLPNSLLTIGTGSFMNCSGFTGDLIIPDNVTTIGGNAFNGCSGFTGDLTIGNAVETIGEYAFANCTGLQGTLTIGESFNHFVGTWGKAFDNCSGLTVLNYNATNATLGGWYWLNNCTSLTTLNIGSNVQAIPAEAFRDLNFSNAIVIPNSVTTIGIYAFRNCDNITTITIGEGVTSMASQAILDCDGLTTVNYNAVNCNVGNTTINHTWLYNCSMATTLTIGEHVQSIFNGAFSRRYDGVSFIGNLTLPSSLQSIGEEAFLDCTGLTGNLVIPNSVTSIGKKAFSGCTGFTGNLTIGNGLTVIDERTFHGCNGFIGTLTIGSSVETIGYEAFRGCSGFTGDLTIPNSVITLGRNCFYDCSGFDGTLTVGEGVVNINESAPFGNCSSLTAINYNAINATKPESGNWLWNCNALTTLTIGPNVESIFESAFDGKSSLTGNLVIPNSVTTIGKNAFKGCSGFNGTLTLSNNLTSIGEAAFRDCTGLTGTLTLPSGLTAIEAEAFRNCRSLTGDLVIPDGVTTIGNSAFRSFQGMTGSLTIPSSVTSIGSNAFNDCRFTTLYYNAINADLDNSWLDYSDNLTTLVIGNQVQAIPDNAFKNKRFEGQLVIPNSVTSIGASAFYNNDYFTGDLVIPNSVSVIGNSAFENCEGFNGTLTLSNSLTDIGSYAFNGCRYITGDLVIPNSVAVIGASAFQSCLGFNGTLTLSNGLTVIEQSTFWGCSNLTGDLVIPNSVMTIGNAAFFDDRGFNGELVIGESVETINSDCFKSAYNRMLNFTSLKVKRSVPPIIASEVFGYDGRDKPVYVPCGAVEAYQAAEYWSEFTNYQEQPMIDLFVASDDESMGTAAITQQPTCSNTQATVTATANTGYMFSNWTENNEVVSTSNPYTFSLTVARNLVAHFEGVTYTITVTADPTAGGSVTGAGGYGEGATATLTATANTGYSFVNWTKGGVEVSANPSYSFTVTEDGDYVAHFSLNSYAITSTADPTAGGTVTGAGSYDYGTIATLTATANTGYTFVNWTKGGVEVSTNPSYSFTVAEDGAYVAHFSLNSYTITATANPSAQGTVNGAGSYNYGATCTLTATPNQGYRFVNWTENNVEVSTNAIYAFTVTEARTLIANFEEITNHWTPINGNQFNMTIYGIILIDGVEQTRTDLEIGAFCGNECRASVFPAFFGPTNQYMATMTVLSNVSNGETLTFRLFDHSTQQEFPNTCINTADFISDTSIGDINDWFEFAFNHMVTIAATVNPDGAGTVNGIGDYYPGDNVSLTAVANEGFSFDRWTVGGETITSNNPYSFEVEGPVSIEAHFNHVQSTNLVEGWNWWSTSIELSTINGLTMLENSLGSSGIDIKSQNATAHNYYQTLGYNYWFGTIPMQNEKGYKVNVSGDCIATMVGLNADPADHPITITNNWNWIGYPVGVSQNVVSALSNYSPTANDVIKGQNWTATYWSGYGWFPTNHVLSPGHMYMYHSHAATDQTLVFAESRVEMISQEEVNHYWESNANTYADNMVVMAVVYVDNIEQHENELELGAFVGDECRGSSRLLFFEPLNRHFAVFTISGMDNEVVVFRLINEETGGTALVSNDHIVFRNDDIVGNLTDPLPISFVSSSSNKETQIKLFPNPISRNQNITISLQENETIVKTVIIDEMGRTLRVETNTDSCIEGLSDPGIYTIEITTSSGMIYHKKIIVI